MSRWTWSGDDDTLGSTEIFLSWYPTVEQAELAWSGNLAPTRSAVHVPIQVTDKEVMVPSFFLRNPNAAHPLALMLRLAGDIQQDILLCAQQDIEFRPIDTRWK